MILGCILKIQKDLSECDTFTFYLFKEILPNGNRVLYKYDESRRISKIITTNPSETKTYASMSFDYGGQRKEKCHDFVVRTSNNKKGERPSGRKQHKGSRAKSMFAGNNNIIIIIIILLLLLILIIIIIIINYYY